MHRILVTILLLFFGLFVYWLFRPNIYIFEILRITNSNPVTADNIIFLFLKNHFADAVWCLAILNMVTFLRNGKYPAIYIYVLLTMPFLSEVLQQLGIVDGTFDWLDILIYCLLIAVYFIGGILCAK